MSAGQPVDVKMLRGLMPLPAERASKPRGDGTYEGAGHVLRFAYDGSATVDGAVAQWLVDTGELRVSSASWDAEGCISPLDVIYLVAVGLGASEREGWVLEFVAGD